MNNVHWTFISSSLKSRFVKNLDKVLRNKILNTSNSLQKNWQIICILRNDDLNYVLNLDLKMIFNSSIIELLKMQSN